MTLFLVRRSLPAVGKAAVHAAIHRCRAEAEALAGIGHHIRYLGCACADDGFCGCVYEAASADVVRLATERAAVPYDEILPLAGRCQAPDGADERSAHAN